ncbi:MAG: anthranilate synthase component I family protein [Nitrospiria bacterium]
MPKENGGAIVMPNLPSTRASEKPIIKSVSSNKLSPIALLRLCGWEENAVLLDGSMGGWFEGAFSLVGGQPFGIFQSNGRSARFDYLRAHHRRSFYSVGDPAASLEYWLERFEIKKKNNPVSSNIPFLFGGTVGFLSYDLIRQFETIPPPRKEDTNTPDIALLFLNFFLLIDHLNEVIHIVFNPLPEIQMGGDKTAVCKAGQEKIDAIAFTISNTDLRDDPQPPFFSIKVDTDCTAEGYIEMVRRAKKYISSGDIFQANLSHRFTAPYPYESLLGLYHRMCALNPSPFASYIDFKGIQIASNSPERLVRVTKEQGKHIVETRPIAGTKPRGENRSEDEILVRSLNTSSKERAEHLMLIDLGRNDLGKICRYGSISVDSMMATEKYSHVSHLVSNIRGELLEGTSALQIIQALFPGGTITGVPKIRCMEIISELENHARGIYTGAIGYIGFDGEIDLNIAIRTCVRYGHTIQYQVGAGIVADSDPLMEYEETLHKATAFLKTIDPSYHAAAAERSSPDVGLPE